MSLWTSKETVTLITLWTTRSAEQIAKELHRPRSAICGKAMRLRAEGILPGGSVKDHFADDPRKRPRPRVPRSNLTILPPKLLPPVDDSLATQPCSILELDDRRCHWPLGNVNEVATRFCGGVTMLGRSYCAEHRRIGSRAAGSAN